ncbi:MULTISPECIES: amidohydrolase [unclassified Duganella]|uniref:amidohydrolase n=1 Tax=unclassified Duganella TaxID=2636909 RepID=UPI0006FA3E16|nr:MULTISPECIES: amidohydrolase [unclassified Duganella]KQV47481.1 amidohydrolase [Duganella sp. Root336D2]KRC00103.1 amidohydrolase [Duganella sp. Root198D2]
MHFRRTLFAAAALAIAGAANAGTMIDNANGYTLNARGRLVQFQALAFDDSGKLVAVGSAREVAARAKGFKRIDVQGKTVLPGLIDAHGHVFGLGEVATSADLYSPTSLQAAQAAVAQFAQANLQRKWVIGKGWNQETWKLGRFPNVAELDAVVGDRPAAMERIDGHAMWVNSKALEAAGIGRDTRDPEGGKIERDANGNATGILVDTAMEYVYKVLPKPTETEARAMLDGALGILSSMGLTSVHDAGIDAGADRLFREYADRGKLSTRVYAMIGDVGADFEQLSKNGPLRSYAGGHYALAAVKLYSDGALGSRGAALVHPYSDAPHTRGLLFNSDAAIRAKMEKAMQAGYQVNVHAIGDAGNKQILDSFEQLGKQYPLAARRHRIEHAQVVQLSDIPRFRQLAIVPSMQPTHATSDQNMAEQRVGLERIKGAYAWHTFLQQGSRIACGSDFPIESPNPLQGIHAAVTRQDMQDAPSGGWHKEQAMTLVEAFRCFTLDAAWAAHQEQSVGSLEKGKWADFIITDRDLFQVPAGEIGKIGVLETWVGGRQVFRK